MKKKTIGIIAAILCFAVLAGVCYHIVVARACVTFSATITEINEDWGWIEVKGLEENDINYRGRFTLSIESNTKFKRRSAKISLDDLSVGDLVSVTFTGPIYEMAPPIVEGVRVIRLLEGEKQG